MDFEINEDLDLSTAECCTCGVIFAYPTNLKNQRLKNKQTFFCPNGHGNVYVGKTEAEKKVEKLQSELESAQKSKDYYQDAFYRRADSIRGYKGQITKLKNKMNK